MNSLETSTCKFVIMIWVDLDDTLSPDSSVTWRGEISDVTEESRTRHPFESLDDIVEYIHPYLEARGVKFGPFGRLRKKLSHLKSFLLR